MSAAFEMTEAELRSDPAELAVIGAVTFHADALAGVLAQLAGSDFYVPARGVVWDVCRELSRQRKPIDAVQISRELLRTGDLNLGTRNVVASELLRGSSAADAVRYAPIIEDLARRRELMRVLIYARQVAANTEGTASDALAAVHAVLDTLGTVVDDSPGTLTWGALIAEFTAAHTGPRVRGIPTPWPELNELIAGLHPGRMYTFGGRPGDGKSTAAFNIALHAAAVEKRQVLVFSQEMPTVDVTGRLISAPAEVDLSKINHYALTDSDMASVARYAAEVGDIGLRVNARPITLAGIKTLARAHAHRHGLDILVVDYLQLVRSDAVGRNREQEVAQVSRELKGLAMELNCAVVLPAQLNRGPASRADGRPVMSDLRDSGQIEQDSDAVILLWHPKRLNEITKEMVPTGDVVLIVDKNRHGRKDECTFNWRGHHGLIGEAKDGKW